MGSRRVQYAALPYRERQDGDIQIRLVTSRETRRWVVPKGWPMKGISPPKAAAREAYEEAGLLGTISSTAIGLYSYEKRLSASRSVLCDVMVFPMKVKRYLKKWPERTQRVGFWFSVESAAAAVQEPELRDLILHFGAVMAERHAAKLAKRAASIQKKAVVAAEPGEPAKAPARRVREAAVPSAVAASVQETSTPASNPPAERRKAAGKAAMTRASVESRAAPAAERAVADGIAVPVAAAALGDTQSPDVPHPGRGLEDGSAALAELEARDGPAAIAASSGKAPSIRKAAAKRTGAKRTADKRTVDQKPEVKKAAAKKAGTKKAGTKKIGTKGAASKAAASKSAASETVEPEMAGANGTPLEKAVAKKAVAKKATAEAAATEKTAGKAAASPASARAKPAAKKAEGNKKAEGKKPKAKGGEVVKVTAQASPELLPGGAHPAAPRVGERATSTDGAPRMAKAGKAKGKDKKGKAAARAKDAETASETASVHPPHRTVH